MLKRTGMGSVGQDHDEAFKLFQDACNLEEPNGCFYLGLIHGNFDGKHKNREDKQKALEFSAKSCKMGHYMGCVNAAVMLSKGDGVPQDAKKAEEYKEEAVKLRTS
jgi:TPR repeat protein